MLRDWYDDAVEAESKKPEWSGENYSKARLIVAERVELA